MKLIAVEEHFATEEYLEHICGPILERRADGILVEPTVSAYLETKIVAPHEMGFLTRDVRVPSESGDAPTVRSALLDVGEGRIKAMDEAGIDVQVLSLVSPGVQVFDGPTATMLARKVNDWLAEKIAQHPDRFVGLATIAPQEPEEAAKELERAVKQLGMKGACINSHTKDEYLDERKYWPIFEAAERLGVPIYLHPRSPSPSMFKHYAKYPELTRAMLGFGAEAALHAMRLICSGLFDEYPKLTIILGHLGEAIPFWLWRMDNRIKNYGGSGSGLKHTPSHYFRENFVVTTSGNFWIVPFQCAMSAIGADSILFAVDYPFQGNWEAKQFLDVLPVSPRDKEKVCHLNAERVFKL